MPDTNDLVKDLQDEITCLECINYSAAYRDGMTDLMTAMTLNKLSITKVEHFDFTGKSPYDYDLSAEVAK